MLACGSGNGLAGKYGAADGPDRLPVPVDLELGTNGRGSWTTDTDTVPFKWELRGNALWLHMKSGGVIVGRIDGSDIWLRLPGMGAHTFKKTGE